MKLMTNVFDLWVFCREESISRYLMLHTSQEKADKWFGGGRFWQIPGEFLEDGEKTIDGISRCLANLKLSPKSIWACEHVYTIYNRRFDSLQIIPVFAAEISKLQNIPLSWEHSEFRWFTAEECLNVINFWGLKDSLARLRTYVTEAESVPAEVGDGN